jgi:hypothetical protein
MVGLNLMTHDLIKIEKMERQKGRRSCEDSGMD